MKKIILIVWLSFTSLFAEPFLGEIRMVGFNFAARGWAECNGQLLAISSNTALFSLLGTMYGGDGRTTFALPDLRGRIPLHVGTGPGLSSLSQGTRGGSETITPTVAARTFTSSGTTITKGRNVIGNVLVNTVTTPVLSPSSQNIRNPYLGIRFMIATTGLFPSRN